MGAVVGRVVLGICAVVGMIGGGALAVMAIVYFGAGDRWDWLLPIGGYLGLVGALGFGIYMGGILHQDAVMRVFAGFMLTGVGLIAAEGVGGLVSLLVDKGDDGHEILQDGGTGAVIFLASVFFAWSAASGGWPVPFKRADAEEPVKSDTTGS